MFSDVVDVLAKLPGPLVLLVVGLFALLETAILAGLILPGEAVVLLGGSLAASGGISPVLVWVVAASASTAGDSIGYAIGHRFGPRLRAGRLGRRIGDRRWEAAEAALARAGSRGVIAGKFVGLVRPLVPPLAGVTRLPYRRFLAASAAASAAWTALLVAVGAVAGASATRWVDRFGRVGWVILALGVPAAVVVALRNKRRARSVIVLTASSELERERQLVADGDLVVASLGD